MTILTKYRERERDKDEDKKTEKYDLIEEVKSFIFQTFGRCIFYTFFK